MNISDYKYTGQVKRGKKGKAVLRRDTDVITESTVIIKSNVSILTIDEIEECDDIELLLEAYGLYRSKARILQNVGEYEATTIYSNLALMVESRLKILADDTK